MSNIFSYFAKSITEGHNGKLNIFPNGFEFRDGGTTNAQGVWLKPSRSADGRLISLSLNVRTVNGCPQPPSDYPQNDRGRYWVPLKECRKCPHHVKRARRQPYPCCAVLRKLAREGPSPAQQVADVLTKAVEKTKELMR